MFNIYDTKERERGFLPREGRRVHDDSFERILAVGKPKESHVAEVAVFAVGIAEALIHSPCAADGWAGAVRARYGLPRAVHWHARGRVLDQKNGNQRSDLPAQITHV